MLKYFRRTAINLSISLTEPRFIAALALVCVFAVFGAIVLWWSLNRADVTDNVWRSHGLGSGWECGGSSGASTTCARDLPAEFQEKKK